VIVKLANIELTPEKPKYLGGSWHVEGMRNESIVASGIYYYVSENITQSELQFRVAVKQPYEIQQDPGDGQYECGVIYGLDNDYELNQPLGSVITQENRCIVFPNIFQHKVAPFELKDKTKPGHRKILVFFLIDPNNQVISTAKVYPQRSDWFMEELFKIKPFSSLQKEILELIMSYCRWPMTLTEAKVHRAGLMAERKYFIDESNEQFFERRFSLCEH